MNDKNENNKLAPDQKLLEEVRSRKILGEDDKQISDELSSSFPAEQIQKALQSLSYMQVTQNTGLDNYRPPVTSGEEPTERSQNMYTQQTLHIIFVIVIYEVIFYLLGFIFWFIGPDVLTSGQGFATGPNLAGASILAMIAAAITYFVFRNRYGLTAFTVLFTVLVLQLFTYAQFALYLAK